MVCFLSESTDSNTSLSTRNRLFIDGRVFFKDLTLKWCVFFLNRLTQIRRFLHETGFLSTVECSTTASIRGPRNRGKVGNKLTNTHIYLHPKLWPRAQATQAGHVCSLNKSAAKPGGFAAMSIT